MFELFMWFPLEPPPKPLATQEEVVKRDVCGATCTPGGGSTGEAMRGLGASRGLSKRLEVPREPPRTCLGPPESLPGGGGPSPSSAIRDMYSSSIFCRSTGADWGPDPGRRCRQSLAMWPVPPHDVQITLLVTLGLSGHCGRREGG